MRSEYTYTTVRELRRGFWREHPNLPRKRIRDYAGTGKMYPTDTRVAWCDWLDMLNKNHEISDGMSIHATLD